jgi:preprotein translocase subunit SecB
MIPPPPLDIRQYEVETFAFHAHSDFDPNRESSGALDVNFSVTQNSDDEREFRIEMKVRLAENGYRPSENAPYSITLDIVGYFLFAAGTSEELMFRMIHANGASILYGVARGFVGQATGAAKYGQFVLPAVNFIDLMKRRLAELDAQSTAGALSDSSSAEEPQSIETR